YEGAQGAVLRPLKLAEAPPLLVRAIIASEDRRFHRHPGIDPIGTTRAFLRNLRQREAAQGGSTITQQLARSLFLQNKKTLVRKATEAVLAVGLEIRYSKEEILEAYLNAVYLGTWGPMEIRGVREASQYYLGQGIQEADLAGIALLVALIPAPNVFSPYQHPELALKRRNIVLNTLAERGVITEAEAKKAAAKKLPSKKPPTRVSEASYFLDAARGEVEQRAPKGTLGRRGVKIFTTLDARDQSAAVAAVERGLAELEKAHRKLRRKDGALQAAVVSIDPATGAVRALVGGRDFLRHPYNRAVEARRQPGSLFKPFVYLAGFRARSRDDGTYW
ncbi:MAG: transglycosylase domain-containing protein, partial [Candidatus Eisenbacteria bacterium]|nr:transglycosylase domain-containing protein [Candidatus Eisenbacteria bacterium]